MIDDVHPFITAWQTRDLETWVTHFAPDIVLRSPIIESTFEGIATATELFSVLFESFRQFEIIEHLVDGQSHAFFWRGTLEGRTIEGVDHIRHDNSNKIAAITVYIRPLVGLGDFASRFGPVLAARRSRARGMLAKGTVALRAVFIATDRIATRLVRRK